MKPNRMLRPFSLVVILMLNVAPVGFTGWSDRQVVADDTPDAAKLQREVLEAYRAADYKKALTAAEKLNEVQPNNADTLYNIACLHCLLGETDKSFEWLEKSVLAGFKDGDHMSNDYDLKRLWGERRFRLLVQRLRDEGEKSGGKDKPADKPKPVVEEEKLPDVPKMSAQEHGRKIQSLTQELITVSGEGKRDKALEIGLTVLAHAKAMEKEIGNRANASLSLAHYNVCCMYALKKNPERALAHLEKAVDHLVPGFDIVQQAEGDSDVDSIRKDPRFKKAIERAKKLLADGAPPERRPRDRVRNPDEGRAADKSDQKGGNDELSGMTTAEREQRSDEFTNKLMEASQKKEYEKALEYSLEALRYSETSRNHYNVACMYSLNKKTDDAYEHLFKALGTASFDRDPVRMLKTDTDLDHIRGDSRWSKAMEMAEAAMAERRALPKDKEVEFKYDVTLPPNHDKSKAAPLLVALHHYHGDMGKATERWKAAAAASGAILLTPQGTFESSAGDSYQWGSDRNLIERNVMKAINEVMDQYKVDEDRVAIAGFSQGGWAAYDIAMRHPDAFCGLIPVAGHFQPESESMLSGERFKSMHVYIMVGGEDNSQLIASNDDAKVRLSRAGASVNMVTFSGLGHGFPPDSDEQLTKAVRFVFDR